MEIFTSEFLKILDVQPTEAKVYKPLLHEFADDLTKLLASPNGTSVMKGHYLARCFLDKILKLESQVRIALAIKEKYNITTQVDSNE